MGGVRGATKARTDHPPRSGLDSKLRTILQGQVGGRSMSGVCAVALSGRICRFCRGMNLAGKRQHSTRIVLVLGFSQIRLKSCEPTFFGAVS